MVYSCTPACCFNHVCAECQTTFETVTAATGRVLTVTPPDPLPDSTEPTAACAKCQSTAVYQLAPGELACAACGAGLTLELTEIAPA